jgi:hypothetical protein
LAGNLDKPLLSLYGTKWRDRGYGLRRHGAGFQSLVLPDYVAPLLEVIQMLVVLRVSTARMNMGIFSRKTGLG